MKKIILCSVAVSGLMFAPIPSGFAQGDANGTANISTVTTPVTSTALTSAGNITGVTVNSILVKTQGTADPIPYLITDKTKYVDDQEAPVPMEKVRPGAAVVVDYVMDGQNRVASRVVVRNAR